MCSCTMSDFDANCESGRYLYAQAIGTAGMPPTQEEMAAIAAYRAHCYSENPVLVLEQQVGEQRKGVSHA